MSDGSYEEDVELELEELPESLEEVELPVLATEAVEGVVTVSVLSVDDDNQESRICMLVCIWETARSML